MTDTTLLSSSGQPARIAFIGGAASTIITLAYLIRDLKTRPNAQAEITVFDPQGLNEGPAYRSRNAGFSLNQPCGKEMDPFHNGGSGLPTPFVTWLQGKHPEAGHNENRFVPRGLFGDYLLHVRDWIGEELKKLPGVTLGVKQEAVQNITVTKRNGADVYTVETPKGKSEHGGVVLATGHSYAPKLDHPQYLATYAAPDFENRLSGVVKRQENVVIIGSGASMADTICALEQLGQKGRYDVYGPYGATHWPYDPQAKRALPNGKLPPGADSATATEQYLGSVVAAFVNEADRIGNPAAALRQQLQRAKSSGIAEQFVLAATIGTKPVQENPALLTAAKAFYGNPLSPERHALMEHLTQEGRIRFIQDRVEGIQASGNGLQLHLSSGKQMETTQSVIDCCVIQRGVTDNQGRFTTPLLNRMAQNGIITPPATHPGALLNIPAPSKAVWVVGPLTNALKNGIETFAPGYQAVSASLSSHIDGTARPRHAPTVAARALTA